MTEYIKNQNRMNYSGFKSILDKYDGDYLVNSVTLSICVEMIINTKSKTEEVFAI
ncbi:hypothetical protein APU01nite_03160 [Alkalibacterium putridalgicola]|uniref:Uncharacterized protein n=1 Tax=Alkalibacterium putridalgicola TaxID=426703 RepID=A0ABQ0UUU5_9LACT|nr:hypothetical protein APU01nite_03160 [Alkalibacterium putridalgicola]